MSGPIFALWPRNKIEGDTSQFGQSTLVDILLQSIESGVFVDIGANDPKFNSNSYFLEMSRGWSGFSFEPLVRYKEIYPASRPKTSFHSCGIGDKSENLYLKVMEGTEGWEDQLSSIQNFSMSENLQQISIYPLTKFDIPSEVDFLSIDVEGYEHAVLDGINWSEFTAKIICIENCLQTLGDSLIRERFEMLGYIYFARLKYIDDIFVSREVVKNIDINKFSRLINPYFRHFRIRSKFKLQ